MMLPEKKSARRRAGFTLVESVVAIGVSGVAIAALYLASTQAIRIVRSAREQALASQVLEQRFETLRAQSAWSNILTVSKVQAVLANRVPTATPLNKLVETYTVAAHPSGTDAFTITLDENNTQSVLGTSLPASRRAVKITGRVTWGASAQHTRTQATILTKDGL